MTTMTPTQLQVWIEDLRSQLERGELATGRLTQYRCIEVETEPYRRSPQCHVGVNVTIQLGQVEMLAT
jgi:hypothetical protein